MVRGDALEGAIAATVALFDVFAVAPRPGEIHRLLLGLRATRAEVERGLAHPDLLGRVESREGYWFLRGKGHLVERRRHLEVRARTRWDRTRATARVLRRTRAALAALATGALAEDDPDERAGVDLILVFPAARFWTSAALARALTRLPGLGLDPLFPGRMLSDRDLALEPRDLGTAWTIARAVPLFGFDVYRRLLEANRWMARFLPNAFPMLDRPLPLELSAVRDPGDPLLVRATTALPPFRLLEFFEQRHARPRRPDREDPRVRQENMRRALLSGELRCRLEVLGLATPALLALLDEGAGDAPSPSVRPTGAPPKPPTSAV